MIDLTVKTLDSQNHTFSVNDDITVRQFKEHIAETVNIPADLQRLIYCGRVLQDEKNLSEYDVNGKVIHLVQRAPPCLNQRPNNASPNPSQAPSSGHWQAGPRFHYRQTQFHGNPMYVGSVSIPADVLDGHSDWHSNTSSADRHMLVAQRMLERANRVMHRLENAAATTVPGRASTNDTAEATAAESTAAESSAAGSTATEDTPVTENSGSASFSQRPAPTARTSSPRESSLVPHQLVDVLELLMTTQERLQPFVRERIIASTSTNAAENQRIFDGVSECLHYLSHAQHAISDINIDMQQPAPRTLRCRPMILQPSAIVQAGLPIQVEAHISLHGQSDNSNSDNEPPPATQTSNTTAEATAPSTESTEAPPPTDRSEQSERSARPESERSGQADSPFGGVFNFPNNVEVVMEMGPQAPRVWSFSAGGEPTPPNNNNNNNTSNNNNTNASNNNTSSTGTAAGGAAGTSGFSWTTAPSPDIIRNLMQAVAGYMAQTGVPMPAPSTAPTTSASPNTTGGCPRHRGRPGDSTSSQTRASTDTHPTTSTQTRTTSRTHVFHQHADALGVGVNVGHGGDFDPYLHCNSQHVRRQSHTSTAASTQTGQSAGLDGQTPGPTTSAPPTFATITGVQILNSGYTGRRLADTIANVDRFSHPDRPISFNNLLRSRGIRILPNSEGIPGRRRGMLARFYTILSKLTVANWFKIIAGDYSPLTLQVQETLRATIQEAFPDASDVDRPVLVSAALRKELKVHLDRTFDGEEAREEDSKKVVAIRETVEAQLDRHFQNMVRSILTTYPTNEAFVEGILKFFNILISNLVGLCRLTLRGQQEGFERVVTRFAGMMAAGTQDAFREWVLGTVVEWICRNCRNLQVPSNEYLSGMLTYKESRPRIVGRPFQSMPTNSQATATVSYQSARAIPEGLLLTEGMETDTGPDPLVLGDNEDISTTFPGSQNLLPDWVPIIARDGARQRRQLQLGLSGGSVTTLSDAYLSTMPSKRRKLVEQQRPTLLASPTSNNSAIPASMERLIRESVGRAGVEEVDGAAAAVASDSTVRRAFGEAVREYLHPRRYETPDFPDPRRFPNASKFFSDNDKQ